MAKADKDGWIRHRGGKCPVADDAMVQIVMREETKKNFCPTPHPARDWRWHHNGDQYDLMYYRIYKPAEQHDDYSVIDLCVSCADEYDEPANPLQWRDRIREIDRTVEALEEERVSLIQRLEGEGFKLIDQVNAKIAEAAQAHEDMSDWRNWKVGDFIVRTSEKEPSAMQLNVPMRITDIDESDGEMPFEVEGLYWPYKVDVEFHSRPST